MTFWTNKVVAITGGTGSFGEAFCRLLLSEEVHAIRCISRDEYKQGELAAALSDERMRFLLGDVRDRDRLRRAFDGVDIVVHAAALKQVVSSEYNPIEVIKTNVMGSANVIEAAIDAGVRRVMAISSDKACAPVNLYGITKAAMEKLFTYAYNYDGTRNTRFACVRYGNVMGSRGSVVNLWKEQAKKGRLTITDRRMTRFFLTIQQAVEFVRHCLEVMESGRIYIPSMASVRMVDVVRAIAPDAELIETGMRVGEKLHEQVDVDVFSDTNPTFLGVEEIRAALGLRDPGEARFAAVSA